MSLFSWLPFGKKAESAPRAAAPVRGVLTGCDLTAPEELMRPFARGPFQRLRPPFSKEAALLSAELANTAYTLDLDAWKAAGWNDFSILIDDSLQSGMDHGGVSSRFKLLKAKAALKELNPFSQLTSALRQREKSDTIKAVCMMRRQSDGRFLLAIGFMGTGGRFYDWISNFRFTPEEGFHRGFTQLCESFEENAGEIVFPAAAQALGLEKLTLNDIFESMRSLSSPFRLWMAGHSQGGAVMQVLCHRLIHHRGVLMQNMVGYGFASPTVATGHFVYDPAAYPLVHILNADDPVPRMGALLHLGLCAWYEPDDAFRDAYYGLSTQPEAVALRDAFRFMEDGMQDMPSVLTHMCALMQVLAEEKGAEGMNELLTSWWAVPAVDKVLWRAGDRVMDALDAFMSNAEEAYFALMGRAMDERVLTALRQQLRPLVKQTPLRKLIDVMSELGVAPHKLADDKPCAYAAIAMNKLEELRPFIWLKVPGGLPVRHFGNWPGADAWPEIDTPAFHQLRRRRQPLHQPRGRMRISYSAQRRS